MFKYRRFRNKGDQGRTDPECGEEWMFRGDGGSTEFGWRGGVQVKGKIRTKGYKRGNDRMGMVQGKLEVSEKG